MQEIRIKTHLIVTEVHDEYYFDWCGKLIDTNPKLIDGVPSFTVIGSKGRVEVNTVDMKHLERVAKCLTQPKGRGAIAEDTSRIYLNNVDDTQTLLGTLTQRHVKTFAPMFDRFDCY